MRLLWITLALALAVIVPFVIWGDQFERAFSQEGSVAWMRDWGPWAWLAGIALLVADLVLPVPSTVVISGLGYLYGPWLGGLIGSAGAFLAGCTAYGLCRMLGHRVALWLVGEKDLRRGEHLFAAAGGWIVVWTRALPVFAEVGACLAGLTRMPASRFLPALACGSLPLGFAFAGIGSVGRGNPALALGLSVAIPPLLWFAGRHLARVHSPPEDDSTVDR